MQLSIGRDTGTGNPVVKFGMSEIVTDIKPLLRAIKQQCPDEWMVVHYEVLTANGENRLHIPGDDDDHP